MVSRWMNCANNKKAGGGAMPSAVAELSGGAKVSTAYHSPFRYSKNFYLSFSPFKGSKATTSQLRS